MEFADIRENNHLRPIELYSKSEYLSDIYNIDRSFTGRLDAWIANTFILESSYLVINSMTLFEKGYFDCAFYSLRQSIETATTMMYLVDSDEETRTKERRKWKSDKSFPMYNQMIRYLEANETTFKNIKEKLSDVFEETNVTKRKLNKFVHKQGFDKLYASRNVSIIEHFSEDEFVEEFESHLKQCIRTIAIMRLVIDPFPVLLSDEEMYLRTGDLMTSSYSKEFIDKYIGQADLEAYKTTDMYVGHYEEILSSEKQSEVISYIIKDQYVDTSRIDEIFSQSHLLNAKENFAVKCCNVCKKITKFYAISGMLMYFTDRETNRKESSWAGKDFERFKNTEPPINISYDEAFISVFRVGEEEVFLEHNEQLDENEIELINNFT